jgi:TP901 family phage tail tape measure protein
MANGEVELKVSLDAKGVAADAQKLAVRLKAELSDVDIEVPVAIDRGELDREAQAVRAFLDKQFDEIPVGFSVDSQGKLRNELGQFVKVAQVAAREAQEALGEVGVDFDIDPSELRLIDNALKEVTEENLRTARTAKILQDAYDLDDREIDKVIQKMNRLEKETDQAKGAASALDNVLQGVGQGLGQALTDIGLEALSQVKVLLGEIASSALEFEGARAAADTLADDVDGLTDSLRQVNGELKGQATTTSLLKASYDVLSAGYTNTADATTILENATKAAVGGFSDTNTVADATTTILNAYGKSAKDAGAITDVLIETQNKGKITVDQYAQQVGKAIGIVASAGVGFQEFSAAIATATAQGVPAESAVSGTRQAIVNLLKPTAEAKDLLAQFGIENASAALKSGGLVGILETLANQGATSDQLSKIFSDVDGLAVVSTLAGENLGKFQANITALGDATGKMNEQFEKIANSLPGLLNSIQNDFSERVSNIAQSLTPLGEGVLSLLRDTLSEAGEQSQGLDKLSEASQRLKDSLTGNPEIAEKLGEALAAVADAGIDALVELVDQFNEFANDADAVEAIKDDVEGLADAIRGLGQVAGFVVTLVQGFQNLKTRASEIPVVGEAIGNSFRSVSPVLTLLIGLLDKWLDQLSFVLDKLGLLPGVVRSIQGEVQAVEASGGDKIDDAVRSINRNLEVAAQRIRTRDTGGGDVGGDTGGGDVGGDTGGDTELDPVIDDAIDDRVQTEIDAQAEIEAATQERIEAEIEAQEQAKQAAIDKAKEEAALQENLAKVAIEADESRLKALDQVEDSYKRQLDLIKSQLSLFDSLGKLQETIDQGRQERLEGVLADESASEFEKQKAARDLTKLTEERFQREQQQLEVRQAAELQQFDLEQKRQQLSDQRAVQEEQIALKKLALQKLEIENQIRIAQLEGDENAVKIGQAQLSLLNEQAAAQQGVIASLEQQAAASQEVGAANRRALLASQEAADVDLAQTQQQQAQGLQGQLGDLNQFGAEGLANAAERRLGEESQDATGFLNRANRGGLGADAIGRDFQQQIPDLAAELRRNPPAAAVPLTRNPTAEAVGQLANVPAAGGGLGIKPEQFTAPIVAELRQLSQRVELLAQNPRQINLTSESPWDDLRRYYQEEDAAKQRQVNA